MPVENSGMSSCFDLMPSTKIVRTEELRELAQRAASPKWAVGAKTMDESKVLNLLRQEGPHATALHIGQKLGIEATTASKVVSDLIDRGHVRRENGLLGDKPRIAAA